jgi:Phospholipase_D-nuclease N-terminal
MFLALQMTSSEQAGYVLIGIMAVIIVLPTLLWIWMLLDCIRNELPGSTEKIKWTVFLLLFGPFAAVVYHTGRRRVRIRENGH